MGYKILAKVLANRLKASHLLFRLLLSWLLHSRQFDPNCIQILSQIGLVGGKSVNWFLALLVAARVFDFIEQPYRFHVLSRLDCDSHGLPFFLNNQKPQSSSMVYSIAYFPMAQGIRQWCPLQVLLFAIAMEPFAIYLKSAPIDTGIIYTSGEDTSLSKIMNLQINLVCTHVTSWHRCGAV